MKRRGIWIILVLLVAALLGWRAWVHFDPRGRPTAGPRNSPPVDLTSHDGETIDFSSGRAVIKDTPQDRAALERAKKEMEAAAQGVTFGPTPKNPEPPPPAPPGK
ncbi:MAG: hypothetical protein PHQ04_03810 [Opitutaceae bacterium]|nr:hypothetical protein [Opitutaceae bacterium]